MKLSQKLRRTEWEIRIDGVKIPVHVWFDNNNSKIRCVMLDPVSASPITGDGYVSLTEVAKFFKIPMRVLNENCMARYREFASRNAESGMIRIIRFRDPCGKTKPQACYSMNRMVIPVIDTHVPESKKFQKFKSEWYQRLS